MSEIFLIQNTNPEKEPQPQPPKEELVKFEELTNQFRIKRDNFEGSSLICGSVRNPETMMNLSKYHKELEDLMRKYKIVQTVASIFAKL